MDPPEVNRHNGNNNKNRTPKRNWRMSPTSSSSSSPISRLNHQNNNNNNRKGLSVKHVFLGLAFLSVVSTFLAVSHLLRLNTGDDGGGVGGSLGFSSSTIRTTAFGEPDQHLAQQPDTMYKTTTTTTASNIKNEQIQQQLIKQQRLTTRNDQQAAAATTITATITATTTPPTSTSSSPSSSSFNGTSSFVLQTGNSRLLQAYDLAKREVYQNIATEKASHARMGSSSQGGGMGSSVGTGKQYFVAGSGWSSLWTRDSSYAIEQGGGLLAPEVSLNTLLKCTSQVPLDGNSVNNVNRMRDPRSRVINGKDVGVINRMPIKTSTVWLQDGCGHFGTWPYLSDAIVGARGAWHLYLYTGNTTFLNFAFDVTLNSLKRGERDVLQDGLFKGCSSFMESNSGYPSKYKNSGRSVGQTKALSTNLLYYNGYKLAVSMGNVILNDPTLEGKRSTQLTPEMLQDLDRKGKELKDVIRKEFWMEDKGYYAYVIDENNQWIPQMEGLGEALVLLSDDFEDSVFRSQSILNNTYISDVGLPCLWPRFNHGKIPVEFKRYVFELYHNGRIWPFVVGYYAVAAARHGRSDILGKEISHMIELSEAKDTFAEFYEMDKSFPDDKNRQLWSDTGFLTMIYHGLFGMKFLVEGIAFAPSRPDPKILEDDQQTISLLDVKYRQATLDIHASGYGTHIQSFKIDGIQSKPLFEASSAGKHVIEIELSDKAGNVARN